MSGDEGKPHRTARFHVGLALRATRIGALGASLILASGCASSMQSSEIHVSVAPSASIEPPSTDSPFSGRPNGAGASVLVLKYDNTTAAQPHRGLVDADVVYVEEVEWGLTRIAAVFATDVPKIAGPIRSARVSDIDLMAQYGNVGFVFSGAQRKLIPRIHAANWVPISQDFGSSGFVRERGTGRFMPTNLMVEPRAVLAKIGAQVATAQDFGWQFAETPPPLGKPAKSMLATWPYSSVQARWNTDKDKWDIWMNGRQARDTDGAKVQRASTVIVQYAKQSDSGYGDKFGGVTPKIHTVGSGKGLLLRDGQTWPITWQRDGLSEPTRWLDADGEPIALDPGQLWVLLVERGNKVQVKR